jgi:serine/threonine-protein kinase
MQNPNLAWVAPLFPSLQGLGLLGQGGQKLVFFASHQNYGDVVLKIIHPSQDLEATRREILAVQTINSPRVPRILEVGRISTPMGPSVWLIEQRILGVTLRERLQQGPLSVDELLRLGGQALEVLVAAEQTGIVHRDVKPENIILDTSGNFWLLDFGISRHLAMSPLTPMTRPFGKFTLGYAPPEQIRNVQNEIDSRADLFALGVVFYESAIGRQPFIDGAINELEVLRRVENDVLPPLNLPCKDSSSMADLLNAILQKRRDHRPATVIEAFTWMQEIIDAQLRP